MTAQEATFTTNGRVGRAVRAVMAAKRISGPTLALRLGVSSQSLYQRLNDNTQITVEDIAAIADALDTPVSDFFGGQISIGWYPHLLGDTDTSTPSLVACP